ncbi:hypothetical protein J0X19_22125 [Hymenobacter sp. BT186]|uniref:Uncharacterized protein n=1 Tax=Hymenobacter telluris TaxID=2816474 RepID=A0A939EZF3_9BACT|nr:hypothetical protein [Hymenobacter telluris]MBO0360674.1 hypothetical protein [Hymenobacter telluris]MBW3376701.1 hypothetical protein [Hymenobacter norwichensis]
MSLPTSFAAGVALHKQLGGSDVYQQLFALGETSYSRQVLARELKALTIVPTAMPAIALETAIVQETVPTPPAALVPTHTASPLLLPLREQLKACRDERSLLHAQLSAPRLSQKDRGKMALRICLLTDQVVQLLSAEAHVLTHGRLPGPLALADVEEAGELRRRLDNLISLRAKVRRRPERAAELPGLEADIHLIREKLTPVPRV